MCVFLGACAHAVMAAVAESDRTQRTTEGAVWRVGVGLGPGTRRDQRARHDLQMT